MKPISSNIIKLILIGLVFFCCSKTENNNNNTNNDINESDSVELDAGIEINEEMIEIVEEKDINISDEISLDGYDLEVKKEIWQPAPGTSWQWQLIDDIDMSFNVKMYDIDLFDVPENVISELHAKGIVVICYFSAGSFEEWRDDADLFSESVKGDPVEGWEGENWLDIRTDLVRSIMKARLDLAVTKQCDGVEPDNVDGYTNDKAFSLTPEDQIDFNTFMANEAHKRGLSVGLKNDLDQIEDLRSHFDWALNEECFTYDECDLLKPFIDAGKAVFNVEYTDENMAATLCPKANAMNFDTLIKHLNLDAWQISCKDYDQ